MKITPGHDFNDYEVGKRAGFKPADMLNMFDGQAHVVQTQDGLIPQDLLGLTREDARKAVVAKLEAEGALVRVEDRVIPTPFGDRSGVVIEPWLTDQWYVDAAKLALPAIQAVQEGRHPHRAGDLGEDLVQLARKHPAVVRLAPIVVGPPHSGLVRLDGNVFVAETVEEAQSQAGGRPLRQDEDVLDTWFSSALWPFATLVMKCTRLPLRTLMRTSGPGSFPDPI